MYRKRFPGRQVTATATIQEVTQVDSLRLFSPNDTQICNTRGCFRPAPIFFLGLLKAILVWVVSMFAAVMFILIKEALFGEKKSGGDSDQKEPEKTNHTENSEHNSKNSKTSRSSIIRCPSCKKKIRVKLPLRGEKAKCSACSSSFRIRIDENGNSLTTRTGIA